MSFCGIYCHPTLKDDGLLLCEICVNHFFCNRSVQYFFIGLFIVIFRTGNRLSPCRWVTFAFKKAMRHRQFDSETGKLSRLYLNSSVSGSEKLPPCFETSKIWSFHDGTTSAPFSCSMAPLAQCVTSADIEMYHILLRNTVLHWVSYIRRVYALENVGRPESNK